jgi:acyl carrier protein
MNPNDVYDQLQVLLVEQVAERAADVHREQSLHALGLDSVEQVALMERVEETFDLTIESADAMHLDTVDALVRYVAARAAV